MDPVATERVTTLQSELVTATDRRSERRVPPLRASRVIPSQLRVRSAGLAARAPAALSTASSTDQQMRPQDSIAPATQRFIPSPSAFPLRRSRRWSVSESDDAAVPPLIAFDEHGVTSRSRSLCRSSMLAPSSRASSTFAERTPSAATRYTSASVSSVSSPNCSCGSIHSNPSPRSLAASPSSHVRSASESSSPATSNPRVQAGLGAAGIVRRCGSTSASMQQAPERAGLRRPVAGRAHRLRRSQAVRRRPR